MADTFVFNHVEQVEHAAMPLYLSLHDLHGLSNLNRTKYPSDGPVGIILRVPLKREWYPGLKDCRVLEYDTEQQVYG